MPFLFDEKLIETLLWFEKQQTGGYGMQMEQYENRKNYVESVKNSFASPGKKTYPEEQEKRPRSFLGLRFVLALFLFLLINHYVGYMEKLHHVYIAVALALICAMLPDGEASGPKTWDT